MAAVLLNHIAVDYGEAANTCPVYGVAVAEAAFENRTVLKSFGNCCSFESKKDGSSSSALASLCIKTPHPVELTVRRFRLKTWQEESINKRHKHHLLPNVWGIREWTSLARQCSSFENLCSRLLQPGTWLRGIPIRRHRQSSRFLEAALMIWAWELGKPLENHLGIKIPHSGSKVQQKDSRNCGL